MAVGRGAMWIVCRGDYLGRLLRCLVACGIAAILLIVRLYLCRCVLWHCVARVRVVARRVYRIL